MLRIAKFYMLAALALAVMPASPVAAKGDTTYAVLHASEPPLAAGQGRIYFYREGGLMGAAIQPTIMIDGISAGGRAKPGDYFYVDRPAGTYEISTETEKKEAITLTLAADQSMYVRMDIKMGLFVGHVQPSIIDAQQAVGEISNCDFHAPKPVEGAAASVAGSAPAAPVTSAPAAPDQTSQSPAAAPADPGAPAQTESAPPATPK